MTRQGISRVAHGRCMPTFLVIGAAKAATTALYQYLGQHPDIFMSPLKEPNFFALEGARPEFGGPGDSSSINRFSITDLARYTQLFAGVKNEAAIGEVSPLYLYDSSAPPRIQRYLPDARLIAILRDPADRAYSNYLHLVRDGRETETFGRALELEAERRAARWEWFWHYRSLGFYFTQLTRFWERFDDRQLKIVRYEDLRTNARLVMSDLYAFLGVDPAFCPNTDSRPEAARTPSHRRLYEFAARPNALTAAARALVPAPIGGRVKRVLLRVASRPGKPQLEARVRADLVASYENDVERLQQRTGLDLALWNLP